MAAITVIMAATTTEGTMEAIMEATTAGITNRFR
jgi:hypothetical protein